MFINFLFLACTHQFVTSNALIKSKVMSAISNYEFSLLSSGNLKSFHSYLKSKNVNCPSGGPLLVNGVIVDSPQDIANQMVDYFSSVLFQMTHLLLLTHIKPLSIIFNGLKSQLKMFVVFWPLTMGPDGIPSLILNRCFSSLCYPLSKLFRKSITSHKIHK